MKKSFVFTLLLATLIFTSMPKELSSANPQWVFYSSSDLHLPNYSGVQALCVDYHGNIWFYSSPGVYFYDRDTFKIYSKVPGLNNVDFSNVGEIFSEPNNNIWIANEGSIIKYDGNKWANYRNPNSNVGCNDFFSLYVDGDNVWCCASGCWLYKYDGTSWTKYDSSNSAINNPKVVKVIKDKSNNLWFGTLQGLVKYDGMNWTKFDKSNSPFPSDSVWLMTIDNNNNLWLGFSTLGVGYFMNSILKYDGTSWTVYSENDVGEQLLDITCLKADSNNNLWVGTNSHGLIKYNGTQWTIFKTSNSPLPSNSVGSIAIDQYNNKWFHVGYGLGVYNENGVVITSVPEGKEAPTGISIYPNPSQKSFTFKYIVKSQGLARLNITNEAGKQVSVLVNELKYPGEYSAVLDATGLPTGNYFVQLISSGSGIQTNKFVIEK